MWVKKWVRSAINNKQAKTIQVFFVNSIITFSFYALKLNETWIQKYLYVSVAKSKNKF
jgi:hypothetical protein